MPTLTQVPPFQSKEEGRRRPLTCHSHRPDECCCNHAHQVPCPISFRQNPARKDGLSFIYHSIPFPSIQIQPKQKVSQSSLTNANHSSRRAGSVHGGRSYSSQPASPTRRRTCERWLGCRATGLAAAAARPNRRSAPICVRRRRCAGPYCLAGFRLRGRGRYG
jgi:hypothetical protein